jgi:hypothetical protein
MLVGRLSDGSRAIRALAAQAVRSQARFERIYLLNALEPGLQAFEISPRLAECQ